jgi:hypothetical protein
LDKKQIRHTNAARAVCDVGAIPADGMTFVTPTQCFCMPYLPGFKAFHPRAFAGEEKLARLEKGQVGRAVEKGSPRDWPMYMANPQRGNWSAGKAPEKLQPLWTIRPVVEPDKPVISAEWRDNWYYQGSVTPVAIAEGVAVFAAVDRQQVVAIDPATGQERWRRTVDGRIDSTPTIRNGMIYVGTRNGWAYALNRDTGEMVWRFFAAPRRERMLAYGQLESCWPLHGSLLVEDDGVWIVAGRHNDADAGMWWWRLDPLTGERLTSGRLGGDELSSAVGVGVRSDGRQSGANSPIVSNGKLLLLSGIYLEKRNGELVDHPVPALSGPNDWLYWGPRFAYELMFPGNQGLLFNSREMNGYKMSYYGFTQAVGYAYRGRDFIHSGETTSLVHRGGDRSRRPDVIRFQKLEKPDAGLGAKVVWRAPYHEAFTTGFGALAVAGDSAFVAFSVENKEFEAQRKDMPHRLRTLNYASGERRQDDLRLPARPSLNGISIGEGRVYVTCQDGSIVCFGVEK